MHEWRLEGIMGMRWLPNRWRNNSNPFFIKMTHLLLKKNSASWSPESFPGLVLKSRTFQDFKDCGKSGLNINTDSLKSIPSETFPLATDNNTAPRPFSHAWNLHAIKTKNKTLVFWLQNWKYSRSKMAYYTLHTLTISKNTYENFDLLVSYHSQQ